MGRWSEVAKTLNSPFSEVPLTAINRVEGLMAVNGSEENRVKQKITRTVEVDWATDPPTHTPETRPTLERLPNSLERMVRAATNDALAPGPAKLRSGLVMDLNAYITRWACCYLTGDTQEASRRLLEAYTALHGGKA